MKAWTAFPIVLLILVCSSGCRFKSPESFESSTVKQNFKESVKGDKYSNGGIAEATGGTKDATQYGAGAKTGPGTNMNVDRDQPAKGSGSMPGEGSGTIHSNGPVYQGDPSEAQSVGRG